MPVRQHYNDLISCIMVKTRQGRAKSFWLMTMNLHTYIHTHMHMRGERQKCPDYCHSKPQNLPQLHCDGNHQSHILQLQHPGCLLSEKSPFAVGSAETTTANWAVLWLYVGVHTYVHIQQEPCLHNRDQISGMFQILFRCLNKRSGFPKS